MFTTLLFLSGYVLQQQTVRSLQAAIRPKAPSTPVQKLNPVLAKHFGRPPGHSFYDKYLASNRPSGGWAKVAYVQLLRSHAHVCNAVMVFAALKGQESMAQRILMYPRDWDEQLESSDPTLATSKRLLQEAASRYKVMLQPIDPIPQSPIDNDEMPPTFSDEEKYPLTNLLSLLHFSRIIYLQPSGLILDVSPLDLLFTLPMTDYHMLGLTSPIQSSADRPAILLFELSKTVFDDAIIALPEGAYPDLDFLSLVHTTPAPSAANSDDAAAPTTLLAETSSLHSMGAHFNATQFLDSTGYIHFQDEGVRGPEYDLTMEFSQAAPEESEARLAWEGVYERYREGRMAVCGLDLVPVPIVLEEASGGEVAEGSLAQEEMLDIARDADAVGEEVEGAERASRTPQGEIKGSELRDERGSSASEQRRREAIESPDGESVQEESQRPLGRFRALDGDTEAMEV